MTRTAPAQVVDEPVQWPADDVQRVPVSRLVPYAKNARTHSAAQIAQIAASIREWGWTTPVLVDEQGVLIAGHGRVLAAKQLGITDIPCMVARGWSDGQKKAYVLADNQLPLNAGWDADLLKMEIREIEALNFDIGKIGFDTEALAKLFDVAPEERQSTERNGPGTPIIQFNIVFDDDAQQDAWFAFVRTLKAQYPNEETLGARLALYIDANATDEGR
jgi:hypothetical protein